MIENAVFQDDDTEESVVTCTLEADLLQNANGKDEVTITVDIRRIQKKLRTKIVPMPCKGDLNPGIHVRATYRLTMSKSSILGRYVV